jgi:alginate O-acetyltransferase complex protein AlgF
LHLLPDKIVNSPARADLVFYNLTDLPLVDLYVPSAKTMALTGVAPNASGQVTLKAPLTLDLEVQAEGMVLATLPAIEMRRRGGVSVVLSGTAGTYIATAAENSYAQ